MLVQVINTNFNSPSYNQTQWIDTGYDAQACPPTTMACTNYRIEVPNSVATNLYIVYTPCGSSTPVSKNWNTQVLFVDDGFGNAVATICMQGAPSFKYGSTGNLQEIPEITVTLNGSCSN